MAFRFRRRERVENGLRRIAAEQLDSAMTELTDTSLDNHAKVHQVRKRFKKLRGLARLVRPGLGERYGEINAWFRDRARDLSRMRDAETLVTTAARLGEDADGERAHAVLSDVRATLALRRDELAGQWQGLEPELTTLEAELSEMRRNLGNWRLEGKGEKALFDGFHKTFKRGRTAMERALAHPTDAAWHQWRKRVKYHWYHTRLLSGCWRPVMDARARELSQLSGLLGDDHDLAVLRAFAVDHRELFPPDAPDLVAELSRLRRARLQNRARALGRRLCAEKPDALSKRMQRYWQIWRE